MGGWWVSWLRPRGCSPAPVVHTYCNTTHACGRPRANAPGPGSRKYVRAARRPPAFFPWRTCDHRRRKTDAVALVLVLRRALSQLSGPLRSEVRTHTRTRMPSHTHAQVAGNKLRELPATLGQLLELEELDAQRNRLEVYFGVFAVSVSVSVLGCALTASVRSSRHRSRL